MTRLFGFLGTIVVALLPSQAVPSQLLPLRVSADGDAPISVSVLSLPASLVEEEEGLRLVRALAVARPKRSILVLSDRSAPKDLPVAVRWARSTAALSAWPRDPFLFAWREPQAVLLQRPNAQAGREGDVAMAGEVLRHWPPEWSSRWGTPTLESSPVAFHAGNLLLDSGNLWVSLHSLEPEILKRLGRSTVPVDTFDTTAGVAAYVRAGEQAATALGEALSANPRWIHPLPSGVEAPRAMARIGAGAGVDLDSYVTFLTDLQVLVASLHEGAAALRDAPPSDFDALATFYELALRGESLRARLLVAGAPAGDPFGAYLDLVAGHLTAQGLRVTRLPLVRIPTSLFLDREGVDYDEFLLNWNNLVLEPSPGGLRAEGFELAFPSVDRAVERILEARGVLWTRLPPLRRSIVLGGGYRCASNHFRPPGAPR